MEAHFAEQAAGQFEAALVVVAENDGPLAELGTGDADAFMAGLVGEAVERVEGDGGGLHAVS